MGNFNSNFANNKLQNFATSTDVKIGFVPNLEIKEDKKKETEKEKIFSNPYEEYIKTWEPGDPLPLIPPGKVLHVCKFHPNPLAVGSETYETQDRYKNAIKLKTGQPTDLEYKVLGRKLKDSVESLLSRAVRGAGRGLWVDDKNKLRCPPGSPNANQFTDMAGSNCLVPTPARAAQSGARAIRAAVTGVAQRAAGVGQRIDGSFDAARATREQIIELGFQRVQAMMAVGGRLSIPDSEMAKISGAMGLGIIQPKRTGKPKTPVNRSNTAMQNVAALLNFTQGAGARIAPPIDEDTPLKPYYLGNREKLQRGQRATQLARSLNDRIKEPMRNPTPGNPGGLVLPDGSPIGDIRDKQNFVRVMSMLFPNVAYNPRQAQSEWGKVYDNLIPRNLTKVNKIRQREALVTFFHGFIAETINNPAAGKLFTQLEVSNNVAAAVAIDFVPFAPLPATTAAGTRSATAQGAAERGGLHVVFRLNPSLFFSNAMNMGGFDTNGRANGIRDTMEGDMHYLATHEFGHLVHFQNVLGQLGFDMNNIQRYGDTENLVKPRNAEEASWQLQNQSNAWMIDFRQARNPTGNKSIQLLIDAATNLSSRSYYGTRGGTRQELERDLNNFHNALQEAILNNITDTDEERELMRQFSGGQYATKNNLETRAEYYAARRLFSGPANAPMGIVQPDPAELFYVAISNAQNPQYTPAQAQAILDNAGMSTFGIRPGNRPAPQGGGSYWNISGRMDVQQNRPTLKTQAVRRAVEKNSGPIRPRISGAMKTSRPFENIMSSRTWKREDTNPWLYDVDPGFYLPMPPGSENIDPGFYLPEPQRPQIPLPPGFRNIISGRMGTADNNNLDSSIRKIVNELELDDNAQNTLSKIVDDWAGSKNEFQPSGGGVSGLESDFLGVEADQEASMQRGEAIRARLVKDIESITKNPEKQKVLWNSLMELGTNINQQISGNIKKREARITGAMSDGSIPEKTANNRIRKNKDGVPQHPRKPTYGPMLGDFEKIFDGVSSWDEFKQKYNDQEVVFLDYETTGIVFDKYGRVLDNGVPTQIGAVKVKDGQIIDRFNIFVNPEQPLGEWSRKNLKDADGNPLTDEYLSDKTPMGEAHRLLAAFAGPNALMGVQNAGYDKDVLDDVLRKTGVDWNPRGWIDLKDMAGMTLPRWSEDSQDGPSRMGSDGKRVPSNSLADITKYLEVDLGKDHHNADKDAEATAESIKKLIDGAIEKKWSTDVLDSKKRRDFVKTTEDAYGEDTKEFDKALADYLVNRISGQMSSSSKNNIIKLNLKNTSNNSEVGGRQTRSYYQNVKKDVRYTNFGWIGAPGPETLEQSEPTRIINRKNNIASLKQFLTNNENLDLTVTDQAQPEPANQYPRRMSDDDRETVKENLNGLDPNFLEYIKNSSEADLLTDLRQAAIEFHAGVDRRPRVNIEPKGLEDIINNGLVAGADASDNTGLQKLRRTHEANIGIPLSADNSSRPVIGYVVHSDTIFAEIEEEFQEFSKNNAFLSDRYNFELYGNYASNKRRGFNSIFGHAEIILKPEVGGRTSYGNGDWLENHVYPVDIDSSDSDVIGRALIDGVARSDNRQMNLIELLYGKFKNNYDSYRKDNGKTRSQLQTTWANRDAFILGGFEPSEIQEIRIPYKEIQADKSLTKSIIEGIVQESRLVNGEPLDRRSFPETDELSFDRKYGSKRNDNLTPPSSVQTSYELKNSRRAKKITYNRITGDLEITYKNDSKGIFYLDRYSDWEQFQTDLNKTTTSKAADTLIQKLETGVTGRRFTKPKPADNEYSSVLNSFTSPQDPETIEEAPLLSSSPSTLNPQLNEMSNVEKTIIQDVLYGVDLNEAIPKRVAVRINDIPRFESIKKDYESLLKVITADKLRNAAIAQEIEFSVTNDYGLNIFSGVSFDRRAAKRSKAQEVLKTKIEKQIKILIKELRKAQKEISGDK